MASFRKIHILIAAVVFGAAVIAGCGGSSNNDQGMSFQAIGWFQLDEDEEIEPDDRPTGLSGLIVPLATDISALNVPLPNGVTLEADGLAAFGAIGFENRMTTQYVLVQRVDCSYTVPGADPSLVFPNDSHGMGVTLDPTPGPDDETTGTVFNRVYATIPVITPEFYAFLNVNRARLPALPFRLFISCRGVGVTQSGDVLETNAVNLTAQFVEVSECCTAGDSEDAGDDGGFQEGPGVGGDFGSVDDEGASESESESDEEAVEEEE
jgi:hypothetical protein